jgi:hypothetical protein
MRYGPELTPFVVFRERAVTAMRRFLGSLGWFRPADLAKSASAPLAWGKIALLAVAIAAILAIVIAAIAAR